MTDYAIIDSSGAAVGTLATDPITGRVTATVQMMGESIWERVLRAGWCDVNWDGFINGADYDLYLVLFKDGNAGADYDGDGWVTGMDVDAFRWDFIAGGA